MWSQAVVKVLVVAILLLWVTAGWVTLQRTLIPTQLAERVVSVEIDEEHQPGEDDTVFVTTEERVLRVDAAAGRCISGLEESAGGPFELEKSAWSRTLRSPSIDKTCTLEAPRQAIAVAVVPPLLLIGCLLLTRRRARGSAPARAVERP